MDPGFKALRHVVLAVDGSMDAVAAVQWVAQQFCRPGDAVHVVHSVLCLLPKLEIYHSEASLRVQGFFLFFFGDRLELNCGELGLWRETNLKTHSQCHSTTTLPALK